MEQAASSTERWKSGRQWSDLDGVPALVKDHIFVNGLTSRNGLAFENDISKIDIHFKLISSKNWLKKKSKKLQKKMFRNIRCRTSRTDAGSGYPDRWNKSHDSNGHGRLRQQSFRAPRHVPQSR